MALQVERARRRRMLEDVMAAGDPVQAIAKSLSHFAQIAEPDVARSCEELFVNLPGLHLRLGITAARIPSTLASLPNAELAEDRVQQVLRRGLAHDFADGVHGQAQFHRGNL